MSYSISITGHKDHDSEQAAEEFESDVADKAAALIAELPGVTGATFYGGRVNRNLMEAQQDEAQNDAEPVDDDSDQTQGKDA